MAILIGADEAGYGPNLGPLVIAATVWQVPDEPADCELYDLLQAAVTRTAEDPERLAIADSKQLYTPRRGLRDLEPGVLAPLRTLGSVVLRWRDAWRVLSPQSSPLLDELPWYAGYDADLPVEAGHDELIMLASGLEAAARRASASLRTMRCTVLFPGELNREWERYGSKGAVLSRATLGLVKTLLAEHPAGHTLVHCDKHGSRNRYGPLLQTFFPEELVEIRREDRQGSVYRWGSPQNRVELRFVARGEGFLPAALASMTAKYLRELAMQAFNAFWRRHLPELTPTAGYPLDAKRFRREIRRIQVNLGIDDHLLWRNK